MSGQEVVNLELFPTLCINEEDFIISLTKRNKIVANCSQRPSWKWHLHQRDLRRCSWKHVSLVFILVLEYPHEGPITHMKLHERNTKVI